MKNVFANPNYLIVYYLNRMQAIFVVLVSHSNIVHVVKSMEKWEKTLKFSKFHSEKFLVRKKGKKVFHAKVFFSCLLETFSLFPQTVAHN